MKQKAGQDTKILTANEFTNVKNVNGCFLYSKDDHIFIYLRIHSLNIDLLPDEEKRAKTSNLSASFGSDNKDFVYFTYPREIDLDSYKNDLKKRHGEEIGNIGKKRLLQEMILEANDLATSGENYEHQHFIKLWTWSGPEQDRLENEQALRYRAEEFKIRYESIGTKADILKEQDILKMCNLFANGVQAPFDIIDNNMIYESITKIR